MSMMAGSDRNVQVNLTANVDPYQSALQKAGQATNALTDSVVKLGRSIDDLVKRAGRRMVLIGASDIAGLTAAAEASNRLDMSLSQVRATSAVTGQSVAALRGQVLDLSKTIPDSTNNIARLVGQVQALGIQGTQNIRNFTETAERLAAATDTPPGQLLQGIVQMNREMGTGLATVNNYSSALIELSKQNGVSANDIMGFAQNIAAVAQQAGYTQTQIMGLATAFTRAGADSAAAANVFTQITSEINQAIVTNNAQLHEFGSLVGMTAQQFRAFAQQHPEQAFERILSAIQQQGQAGILTLQRMGLDGNRAIRVIASLTGGQANMAQSMNQASDAYQRNSALTKSSQAAWSDLSAEMQKMRNEINDIAIRLGGPMAHALDIMVKGVNMVLGPVNTFLGLLGPIPGIVAGIGGAFLAVTGTLTTFAFALLGIAAAWRLVSGVTGTGMLQGLVNGFRSPQGQGPFVNPQTIVRRNPINMASRSPMGQRLYGMTYGLGQRFSAPPPEDPNFTQRLVNRTGRMAGSILTFPLRKTRAEITEAADTLRHPFNPWARSIDATSPYSALGMYQRANRWWVNQGGTEGIAQGARIAMTSKLGMDTSEAEAKLATVKEQAQQRVTMRLDAGRIPMTDLRTIAGGQQFATTDIRTIAKNRPDLLEAGPGFLRRTAGAIGGATTRGVVAGGRGLLNMFGSLSDVLGTVIGPLGMLAAVGIPLYEGFKHLHNAATDAAEKMDDLGAALVRTAGGTYNKPQGGTVPQTVHPADKPQPFGQGEISTAYSKAFTGTAGSDIAQLRGRKGVNRSRVAQELIQNVIANNNGAPLSTSQQQALREELIAAYGPQAAQNIYRGLNLAGVDPLTAARTNAQLLVGTKDDSNITERQYLGTNSSKRIQQAITPVANQMNSGQFAQAGLGLAVLQSTMNAQGVGQSGWNQARWGATSKLLVDSLNKGVPSDQKINIDSTAIYSLNDFMAALHKAGGRGAAFADQLEKAGLNANNLSTSINTLNTMVEHSTSVQRAQLINQTTIGRTANAFGFNLSNTNDVNYATEVATTTYSAMRGGGHGNVPDMTDISAIQRAIQAWQQYRSTLDATDPAAQTAQQQIDALNQSLQTQNAIFQTPAQQAGGLAKQTQSLIGQMGTGGWAGQQEQTYIGMAQSQIASAENQLKSYMTTVHQYRIQERDAFYERNVQIQQMNHEFNEQLRQTNYQMAQSFGNPAQMVQSQFTMGASSAMIGMTRQLDMMRQSKSTMDRLHQMGLSRDAIRLMGLDDPKNVEQAQRYLSDFAQNPKLIKSFNDSIKGRLKISAGIDTDYNNSKFADMKRQFDYQAQQASNAFKHSQQVTQQSINELGKELFTSMADLNHQAMASGLSNIQQYASGIMTAIKQVQSATTNFLDSTASGGGAGGGAGGGPTVGGRKWTGVPTGPFQAPGPLRRVGGHGVNAGFLLSSVSRPGHDTDHKGNPDLRWGKDVAVAPDNRTLSANARLSQTMAKPYGWSNGPEWAALYQIWNQESGFNTTIGSFDAAYGIPQADPGTKMAKYGDDWKTNPRTQIRWGLDYIAGTYGDPLGAWAHKARTGWYQGGSVFGSPQVIGVGEAGPEAVIPLNTVGVTFVSHVISSVMSNMGISRSAYAMTHTAPRASVVYNAPVSHHMDASTNFNGPITVEASDPNEMQRKLEQRKRLQRLRNPHQ